MKQWCHDDFHWTFQKLVGSCRCALCKSLTEACRAGRVQHVRCSVLINWSGEWKMILTCALDVCPFVTLFCCHWELSLLQLWLWICYIQLLVCHFCPHGQLLDYLPGVRKFLSVFFHWKATLGLGAREGLLFMCFCLYIKDRMSRREMKGDKKSETQSLFPVCWCVSYNCICVFGREDCTGVRDSDGVERVWCTVITRPVCGFHGNSLPWGHRRAPV